MTARALASRIFAIVVAIVILVGGAILLALNQSGTASDTAAVNKGKIRTNELKINGMLRCLSGPRPQSCIDRLAGPRGPGGGVGRTGARGERGGIGRRGTRGARGRRGATGVGRTGARGPRGQRGAKGDKGDEGGTGRQGDRGIEGIDGMTTIGPAGPMGADGPPGTPAGPFTFSFTDQAGTVQTCTIDPTIGPSVVQPCTPNVIVASGIP